jgi:ribosomal protein S18 acetylase RimI-like enzyme
MMVTDRAQLSRKLTFRSAAASDEGVLVEMLYRAVFVAPGTAPPPRSIVAQPQLARYVSGWGRPGDDGEIAAAPTGEPIGAAWLRLWSTDDQGYGFVDVHTPELSMAVRPEFRGQGIGSLLLQRILLRADRTHESVSLSVSLQNPAVRLYEKFGFERLFSDGTSMTMRRMRAASGSKSGARGPTMRP